jgi:ribosomal-protein-alanine N-acetyltransferase
MNEISNIGNVFKDLQTLETPRLRLRKLTMRDANDVFEYASMPEVSKHVTWDYHRTVADSMAFLKSILLQYENGIPSPWGIVYKELNKLIGTGGFHNWNLEHRRAEVGYAISSRYWNKGIMTETLKRMLRFGFEAMALNRIEALCKIENAASEKVMQKCGMKYEGTLRKQMFVKGDYQDLKIYSILKQEFNTD